MKANAEPTPPRAHWLAKPFVKVSIGRQLSMMRSTWSGDAERVNSTPSKSISRPRPCRSYHFHGHLLSGGSIFWDRLGGPRAGLSICMSRSTSSLSGPRLIRSSRSISTPHLNSLRASRPGLECLTVLLRIMAPNSLVNSSATTAKTWASSSASPHLPTPEAMAKWSAPIRKSSKALKPRPSIYSRKHGDSWIEELPAVLWANRTTPSRATGETPFFLIYSAEAVLPSELTLRSPRATMYCEADQDQLRRDDLDYLEERRRRAALRAARYQQSLRRYHQRHVRARSLCVDDLVLRRVQTRAGLSKLSPMWEGPYRVIGVPRPGSVRLATGDGTELPNPWNIEHLRRFYP